MRADARDVRQQAAVQQLADEVQPGTARQQIAAVRAAVIAEVEARRATSSAISAAPIGNAGAERLADRDELRPKSQHRIEERVTGATEPALDLVADHERARAIARRLHGRGERRGQRPHAPFALNRLEHDRRGLGRDRGRECRRSFGGTNVTPASSGANGSR